jgi:proprotein convertase subtilisin/kexin type 5
LHQSKKPLEFDFKVKVALDAARAIRFLHQNNILHRDIKPDNLLIMSLDLNAPVAAKLTDFGTSRAVSKLTNQYTTGIGTPSYMAPEILSKKPYDTKADVYRYDMDPIRSIRLTISL